MKELFERFVMYCCFAGLGGIAVVAFVRATLPTAAQKVRMATEKVRRHGVVATLAVAIFVCGMIVYGSSKNNSQTNEPPSRMLVRMTPSGLTNALVRVERWWRRGALNDGEAVTFDSDWCFPYGTNHLTRVEVWAAGAVYPSEKDPTPIAELMTKLSLKPHDTEVFIGRTTNNSYRIEWLNGHPNRAHDQAADASIELCRNGDAVVTEGGVTTEIPYEMPFAHSGFGQDEAWVRANFTNAEEILSIGYTNWVDAQVGVGLLNGLYKFTASFDDVPPEPTQLYIGDYSVCVTNAGDYVFLLEKGTDYEFGTWPFDDTVDYYAQDDMAADAPMLMSWWGGWESPGEWTVDGGWNWLYYPSPDYPGSCNWMPTLQGSPDVAHLGPDSFPATFAAILTDYCGDESPTFHWSASSEDIQFANPNAQTTTVTCASLPSWGSMSMSVQANLGWYSLYSYLYPTYGTNETPQVALSVSAPKVIFVNDDDRTSRWYRVSIDLFSPTETNAAISIAHSGNSNPIFSSDPRGSHRFSITNISLSVDSPMTERSYEFYVACQNSSSSGRFAVNCTLPDSSTLSASRDYIVTEPLRKLVTMDRAGDGRILNPSRLVYGTNAWLQVDQNGHFPSSEIKWRVVSGPGEIVVTNRYRACVRPTAESGTVVVEAAFGSDALIQPRFVLPVVEKRRIPICVYYIEDSSGSKPARLSLLENDLEIANNVFLQVGVEFYLEGSSQPIANSGYARLPECGVVVGANGRRRLSGDLSNMAMSLLGMFPRTNGFIKVVYVHEITHGTKLAFTVPDYKVVVMGSEGLSSVLAHELGHTLGLGDIYSRRKRNPLLLMPGWNDQAYAGIFSDEMVDWGTEPGRSFYEASDSHGTLIDQLLMNGINDYDGRDIPSGNVLGYPPQPANSFDRTMREVGASRILENVR